MAKKKFPALGRGLDALISLDETPRTAGSSQISEVPLRQIKANPNQPRRQFDEEALAELAESIRQIGIIQPVTLRKTGDDEYEIIAGERRWRASQVAGLDSIPAYIRTADDENVMQMALVENIQREDLNPIEIALAYQRLMEQGGLTQDKLAEKVGKKRTTVANFLRLLRLPAPVQLALRNKTIDQGHARALLALDKPSEQVRLFKEIGRHGYSVRQVEELVRAAAQTGGDEGGERPKRKAAGKEWALLKDNLSQFFRTKVSLSLSASGKGRISIPFASEEELERIVALLDGRKSS